MSPLGLRPVVSLKHILDVAGSTTGSTKSTVDLIKADEKPELANVQEVAVASRVSSIFLNVQAYTVANATLRPNFYMYVMKNPGNNFLTTPEPSGTGGADKKRFILHQEMIMLGVIGGGGFPRTVFKGVIKIPPRLRRFGWDDRLQLVVGNGAGETTQETGFCVQCIYKEFR